MRSLRCVFKPAQLVWFTGFSADVIPVGASVSSDKTLMSYVSAPLYSTSFGSRVLGHSPLQHFLREEVDSTRSPPDGDGHPPALCSSSFTLCDGVCASCLVGLPLDSARPLRPHSHTVQNRIQASCSLKWAWKHARKVKNHINVQSHPGAALKAALKADFGF